MSSVFSQQSVPALPLIIQKQEIEQVYIYEGPALPGVPSTAPATTVKIKTTHHKSTPKFVEMTIQFPPPHQQVQITSDTASTIKHLLTVFDQK